ncbi:MAG: HDOD domain-containing protein [Bdellovibrionales bacterium]|nr:HDOD domain-containing protein [Bdellovibrionales bacterium]
MSSEEDGIESVGEQVQERKPFRVIPVDRKACEELLELLGDQSVRVDKLNTVVCRDPILTLEFLRLANGAKNISGGKTVLSTKAAILALGLQNFRSAVETLREETPEFEGEAENFLKTLRLRSRKAAIASSIIARYVDQRLAFDCFCVGLFSYLGDILALAKHQEPVVGFMQEGLKRSQIRYKLSSMFRFDLETETIRFLKTCTVPAALINAHDRESSNLDLTQTAIKNVVLSAGEFVDAQEEGRLDRLGPGKPIPPKSFRRMLQLTDAQYESLFEELTAYLESGEFREVKAEEKEEELATSEEVLEEELEEEPLPEEQEETEVVVFDDDVEEEPLEEVRSDRVAPPPLRESQPRKSEKTLSTMIDMFEEVDNVTDLLSKLLDMLIEEGPFTRAALMVIDQNQKLAVAVVARGDVGSDMVDVKLTDPLSPLLHLQSRVVSYSKRKSESSPFGCPTFALAPIDAGHTLPVALYADCGDTFVLSFDARRLFRKVVDILNNILPQMTGAIPMERGPWMNQ